MLEIQGNEALELVTQHRRWLANDRRGKRADLSLRTLRGLDLRGADLTRAKLTGAQFINCNLDGAILIEADLFSVNLSGTSFRKANCRNADFRGAVLSAADFTDAKLMGCDFRDGTLLVSAAGTVAPAMDQMELRAITGTKMARADLAGAKLHHAVIKRTDMSAAVLRNADLSGANLTGSSLKDADLRGANLTNCDLSRTLMNRAIVDGANLSGAVLRDANIFSVDFRKAAYLDALDLRESISVDDSKEAAEKPGCRQIWIERERLVDQRDAAIEVAGKMRERMAAPGKSDRIVIAQLRGALRQPGAFGHLVRAIIHPAMGLAPEVAPCRHRVS